MTRALVALLMLASFSAHGQTYGYGIAITEQTVSGVTGQIIAVDDSVIPRYKASAGVPMQACTAGRDLYVDTAAQAFYFCAGPNLWIRLQTFGGNVAVSTFKPIAINCGGPAYTDASGLVWAADTGFTGGATWGSGAAVSGWKDSSVLYQTAHWGNFQYQFAVPNGQYTVTLKFAELYWTQPGKRVFHVAINGNQVLTGFDIFAAAGGTNVAIDKSFPVTVTDGKILIAFANIADYPFVNGIKITSP